MLKNFIFICIGLLILPICIQAQNGVPFYDGLFNQFLRFNETWDKQIATVQDLKIEKDAAQFHLKEGQLYLLPLINGRPAMMIFKGSGKFNFTPPTKIEKENLHRFFETDTIEVVFNNLFMIFADSTFEKITQHTNFSLISDVDLEREADQCMPLICNTYSRYLPPQILKTFLNGTSSGLFYAQIWDTQYGKLFYMIDPYAEEEVKFMRSAKLTLLVDYREVISQFRQKAHFEGNAGWDADLKSGITISQYKIESRIADNLDLAFYAVADLTIQSLIDNPGWIFLNLAAPFQVDSVVSSEGELQTFRKGRDNPHLWINLKPKFLKGDRRNLKIYYHGEFLENDSTGRIRPTTTDNWYPNNGYQNIANYDLTFHSPARFPYLVSVGRKVSYVKKDDIITSRWVTGSPVSMATFNLGDYEAVRFEDMQDQPVKILGNRGSDLTEDVGADIINSYALYTNKFGPCPIDTLYAIESLIGHGQAFPGLLHLSVGTYNYNRGYGYSEIFRAHEVAHQWWGLSVRPSTYHDYWLAEGLSDFCGLLYLQTIFYDDDGTDKYFEILNDYRENILQNRQYLIGSGQEAGPIWLGYRTKSSTTEEDYSLIIYKKSAWVFHMLRIMMINQRDLRDETMFYNMLKNYHTSFRGKKASSADFKKIVEKHIGMEMDWFFEQWIEGTGIPEYQFEYQVEETVEEKYLIKGVVTQRNVPADFKMPLLLKIDFGDNGSSIQRRMISGPETRIEFLSPIEPEDIIFNYLESVLCTEN